jgi:uncharacterized protein
MATQILFIQGAGQGAYAEDKLLADSLQQALGSDFKLHYPAMPDEDNAPYLKWRQRIKEELALMPEPIILVGHSVGASALAKYLSEAKLKQPVAGIFLLENPFWGGAGWRYEGYEELELPQDASRNFPRDVPTFLYHTRDDEVVPFAHLALYVQAFPWAAVRELAKGGHQLNNDLSAVAGDIKHLMAGYFM